MAVDTGMGMAGGRDCVSRKVKGFGSVHIGRRFGGKDVEVSLKGNSQSTLYISNTRAQMHVP